MADKPIEGVFAIHKPPVISSAEVIRQVQAVLNPSKLYETWIRDEGARLRAARSDMRKQRFRKRHEQIQVKIGHGGTLDPLATGVLVLGVGSGTKRLGDYQKGCTKSYETVVLFGQATDSYDILGKTVARKAYEHITKDKVEKALEKFRGDSMQTPPIYSAIRIDGKRLYEYAREGKELPRKIEERPVTIHQLELLEWFDGGTHQYHWPKEEADQDHKNLAEKVFHFNQEDTAIDSTTAESLSNIKRSREIDTAEDESSAKRTKVEAAADPPVADANTSQEKPMEPPSAEAETSQEPCPAPACRLRMSVNSGFYVRSLCHDLGQELDSVATMAALVRTKQAEFELGKNVFEFDELAKGEDTWAPQILDLLSKDAARIEK